MPLPLIGVSEIRMLSALSSRLTPDMLNEPTKNPHLFQSTAPLEVLSSRANSGNLLLNDTKSTS